jgi:hypothetical protein
LPRDGAARLVGVEVDFDVVGALLGGRDAEVLAQQVQHSDAIVDSRGSLGAVDAQPDVGEVG